MTLPAYLNFDFSSDVVIYGTIIVVSLVLLIWIITIESRFRKILGRTGKNTLIDALDKIHQEMRERKQFEKEMLEYLKTVEKRVRRSIQSIETIRFNPFKGTGSGGNQSFSTAFLNEDGNGVVFSSLYSRDRVSLFSKPVKKNQSEFELTGEERQILKKAQESCKS